MKKARIPIAAYLELYSLGFDEESSMKVIKELWDYAPIQEIFELKITDPELFVRLDLSEIKEIFRKEKTFNLQRAA